MEEKSFDLNKVVNEADDGLCTAMNKIEEIKNYEKRNDLTEQCSSLIRKLESVQEDLQQLLKKDEQS